MWYRQAGRQAGRQADRQAGRQTDRQTDRQKVILQHCSARVIMHKL